MLINQCVGIVAAFWGIFYGGGADKWEFPAQMVYGIASILSFAFDLFYYLKKYYPKLSKQLEIGNHFCYSLYWYKMISRIFKLV